MRSWFSRSSFSAMARSDWATVKQMSLPSSWPMPWRMMSTLMLCWASREKTLKDVPISLGTPRSAIRAIFVSLATLLIYDFSIRFATSFTFVPGFPEKLDRTSRLTLYFFAISTERLCSTWAPRVASSSISLYVTSSSFLAWGTSRGSAV